MKLLELLTELQCSFVPYPGGGFQVFYLTGIWEKPVADVHFWHLSDAHVVGTLSGPSLHVVSHASLSPVRELESEVAK